jgi:hypothetical protein
MPMNQPGDSAPAPIDDIFPSIVVPGDVHVIDDSGAYGETTQKPDFVRADDENFRGA